uniref:Uncharacterized protein n=1 Tax=viral metagenome TaxID=1070528 RepID=A0A6C0BS63_9ZZZZ
MNWKVITDILNTYGYISFINFSYSFIISLPICLIEDKLKIIQRTELFSKK